MTDALRVLVVAAHPDDIEFGAAGSVAGWTAAGAQVTYCVVTNGAAGSNKPGEDLAALVTTREAEERASAALVGVTDVRFLRYQDGVLQPTLELRRDLTRLIRELRPHRVITHDPTLLFFGDSYINHPDHRAVGEATCYAVFPSAGTRPIFPELLAAGFEPHDADELWLFLSDKADVVVDISAHIEAKIAGLQCHKTQLPPEIGDEIRKWGAEAGKEKGYAYAETFRVMKLRQPDPNPAQEEAKTATE